MAVDRFPVEYSHIMMFARSVGDPNPIYHDPEAAKATEPGAVIAPRLSSSLRPSSILQLRAAPEDRRALVRFRQEPLQGLSRVPAVAVTAAASTLSSTTSITAILRPGMC